MPALFNLIDSIESRYGMLCGQYFATVQQLIPLTTFHKLFLHNVVQLNSLQIKLFKDANVASRCATITVYIA